MKKTFTKSFAYLLCIMLFAAMTLTIGCGKKTTDVPAPSVSTEAEVSVETETSATETASVEETVEASVSEEPEVITADESEIPTLEGCELGEGETQFTFVVVDKEGNETTFTINTNETTVGAALLGVNLIAGEDSAYGLYVKNVNGIVADYDVDQTYWAFYIDGDYAMTGVDATEVVAGSTYTFKVE